MTTATVPRWRVWALWSSLMLVLLVCPALVAGPMLAYVLDPELLVLALLFGTQSGRLELSVLGLRLRVAANRVRGRTVEPRPATVRHRAESPLPGAPRRGPSRGPAGSNRPARGARGPVRPGRTARSRCPAPPR